MYDLIARVLAFFYELPVVGGSYGLAIILLTATVMMLLMPLTIKATRSTIKMQEVQPKLRELQKLHKGDRNTLNAELMDLYKNNGINPVGGCLPMVAQLPVFLVLFNVLRGLSRRVADTPFFTVAEQARAEAGGSAVEGATFDPKYLDLSSEMSIDLHETSTMDFGPFDLAQEPLDVLQSNFVNGIPYVLLILFVVATSFYQQRQISSRRTGGMGMNPQQEMILKFLPLMSGIWSFAFPAGLVLYWATSNVFRIGQQGYITRAFYSRKEAGAAADEAKAVADTVATVELKKSTSDGTAADSADDGEGGGAGKGRYRNGRSPRTRSGPQPVQSTNGSSSPDSADANGSAPHSDQGHGRTKADRERAWEQRRREKARVQGTRQSRTEQSSRITPKGTKPSDPKKKRKR